MFSTFKQKLMLGVYIFLILSIPIGAYLSSQFQTLESSASQGKTNTKQLNTESPAPISPGSATSKKIQLLEESARASASPIPTTSIDKSTATEATTLEDTTSPTIASSFGPTLSIKVSLEGRPTDDQSGKVFVGIIDGPVTSNPKFLLNYYVEVPKSGVYDNISLAGLSVGSNYTAILKGSAQIASASAFTMSPTVTKLNQGQSINLLTGDLNEDNVINSSDYSIMQNAMGTTPSSATWNANLDFNKDNIINLFDLAYIIKNFGVVGDSGTWYSTTPLSSATSSASLSSPPNSHTGGYWIWVPQ